MINHIIETPRLILRRPRLEDAKEINLAILDVWDQLQLWMNWAYDGEETLEATEHYILSPMGAYGLAGFSKETGELVLMTGLGAVEDPDKDNEHATGYWVTKNYLGQGYATEATNAAIRYGFDVLKASAIRIDYFADNEKSRRVIEKLGFEFVRTVKDGHKRCLDGLPMDVHEYIMRNPARLPPLDVKWECEP